MLLTLAARPSEKDLPDRLAKIAANGPTAIGHRLEELDNEWTTGRAVKASTGLCLVAGFALAAFLSPWWLVLPAAAGVALVHYLFFRRSWLAELFSAAGLRTGAEIEDERIALRVLRGDFQHLPTVFQVEDRDAVCRMEGEGGACVGEECEKIEPKVAAALILEHTATSK